MNFNELKKNLKKDFSGLPVIKVAVLADSASQLFCMALKAYGFRVGIYLQVWEADYDQIYQTVLDENSPFYAFAPDHVIIWQSSKKMLGSFYKAADAEKKVFADTQIEFLKTLKEKISTRLVVNFIILNYPEINDSIFGNFANKTDRSFLYQQRKMNWLLMEFAAQNPNINICDLSALQNTFGSRNMISEKLYVNSDNIFDIDFLPQLAKNITDIILAYTGRFKKCLIADLDNTLWGGVIGDDGMEGIQLGNLGIGKAYIQFQQWILQLKNRGIILAVCSKNTEDIAREPFDDHPDMVLKFEDLAVFIANWENKADNLRQIQAMLNIGFDSMVFLDDNPAERELVKRELPEVTVPDLPEDPAEYLSFLYTQNLFETVSFTEADAKRNDQYREEAGRVNLQKQFTDEAGFLKSLEMKARVKEAAGFLLPRAAQLTQRSNQFNLRTRRYTEEQMKQAVNDKNKFTMAVSLKDKFGDYGLISLLVLEKTGDNSLFIDTWIMSCRVLKRNVEEFVMNQLILLAENAGCNEIRGEYLPTPKNSIVKDHYSRMGFIPAGKSTWKLPVKNENKYDSFIKIDIDDNF